MTQRLKLWHLILLVMLLSPLSVWGANTMWSALSTITGVNTADGDRFVLLDISDTTHGAAGTAKTITRSELKNNVMHAAGSASAGTWPLFGSGTVLTTAEDGALEQDADNFYLTTDAGNRGIVPVTHYIRVATAQTLSSVTSAQNIFDSPANGRITLETGTYEFELLVAFTGMSATTGNGQILFACGGTCGGWLWMSNAIDGVATTTLLDLDNAFHVTNASAALVAATAVNTTLRVFAKGSVEVTAAGTFTPQIALTTAAAATVVEGSYFTIQRLGATGTASIGQWD
jgi:hypothetical protein